MRLSRSMVLPVFPALAAVLLGGCTPPPPKPVVVPPPAVATPEQAGQVHDELVKILPGAVMGSVAAVKDGMAAVSGISAAAVKKGDSIQFLDASSMGIANGSIVSADPNSAYLVVEYTPTAGGRAPMRGDMAVYIPSK